MKNLYLLITTVWNGTVVADELFCVFNTMELTQKAKKAVDEANSHRDDITTRIVCIPFFENENEVPILQPKYPY